MGSMALYLSPAIGGASVFACEGEVYAPDEGGVVSAGAPWTGLAAYSLRTFHRLDGGGRESRGLWYEEMAAFA